MSEREDNFCYCPECKLVHRFGTPLPTTEYECLSQTCDCVFIPADHWTSKELWLAGDPTGERVRAYLREHGEDA